MLENSLLLEQRQTMSTNQIQSMEILAYTNQELENFLLTEYLENPMLDNSQDKQDDLIHDLEQLYEKNVSYKDHYLEWEEEDCNRTNDIYTPVKDEINDFLMSQLNQADYKEEEWALIRYLIGCLDDEGFFHYESNEIARTFGCSEHLVRKHLKILRELEPVGIFSSNISECLKKQLEWKDMNDEILLMIVDIYMSDILRGQIGTVSRNLNLSTTQVKEYIHLIGDLNPRPIMNLNIDKPQYIIPDILITLEKERWNISLNDNWMGEYKFNEYYIHMMKQSKDAELTRYFREKLERARFIIHCIEQRRGTILKVVEEILELQENYFKFGKELKPMTLEDISVRAGVHISTVSRAIKDKYIQYKRTVLLKDLFTSAASQSDVSVQVVKTRVKKIIEQENSQKPYSDLKIAEIIQEEGIPISRRTVAKYRKLLGIPESRQRLYL